MLMMMMMMIMVMMMMVMMIDDDVDGNVDGDVGVDDDDVDDDVDNDVVDDDDVVVDDDDDDVMVMVVIMMMMLLMMMMLMVMKITSVAMVKIPTLNLHHHPLSAMTHRRQLRDTGHWRWRCSQLLQCMGEETVTAKATDVLRVLGQFPPPRRGNTYLIHPVLHYT